jgi:hypothetical protein
VTVLRLDARSIRAGVDAAEDLLEALHVPLEKAIDPTTRGGFLRIVARLRDAMSSASAEGEAQALRNALRTLDVDWAALNEAGRDAVLQATRAAIGGSAEHAMPRIVQAFEAVGPATANAARAGAVRRFSLDVGTRLLARDLAAERFVRMSTANFIRDEYGRRADELAGVAREVVAQGLADGIGRDAIAARLRDSLGDRVMRGDGYWQVVANQFVGSARTFSVLGAFEEAGIGAYRFEAVMDEVTCFAAGTRVLMANGRLRKIERIRAGDVIVSCRGVPRRVTALRTFAKRTWGTIELSSGRTLRVTPNHPILTLRGWVRAGKLREDDRIVAHDRNVRDLFEADSEEARSASEDVHGMHTREAGSAARLSILRRDVHPIASVEAVGAGLLLGGLSRSASRLRALRQSLPDADFLYEERPGSVLLHRVSSSWSSPRLLARGPNEDLQAVLRIVRDQSGRGEGRQESPVLLEGVPAHDRNADLRGMRHRVSPEGQAGGNVTVLLHVLLPPARGRDEHRADHAHDPRSERDPVRAGGEDRSLVDRLPSGGALRARGRRGVLARELEGQGAGRGAGRRAREARLRSGTDSGARTEGIPARRDPCLAGLWPRPVDDLSFARTVAIASIRWELTTEPEPAYDVEVEADAGYVAEGVVVHNTDQCRFYHGQIFSTAASIAQRDRLASLEDPDQVYDLNPWVRSGRDEQGNRILYVDRGGQRTMIAQIDRSGVGARDDRGSYSRAMSSGDLQGEGIPWPPLHANCRSEIVPAGE